MSNPYECICARCGQTYPTGAHHDCFVSHSDDADLRAKLAETEDDLRISCGDVALKTEETSRLRRELAAAQKRVESDARTIIALEASRDSCYGAKVIELTERAEKAERIIAALVTAVERHLVLHSQPGENATATYERIAETFYRETRLMAPGKSEPVETNFPGKREKRKEAWDAWCKERVDTVEAALAKAKELAEKET